MKNELKIRWIGQGGYLLSDGESEICIDPYLSNVVDRVAKRGRMVEAPITPEEQKAIEEALDAVWNDLSPAAQAVIKEQGVSYIDEEADLVTSIVDGRDCVFTCYGENGMCYCALEKAYREGRSKFYKPLSCHLYPVRLQEWSNGYTALNYHRWKICKAAEVLGRKEGVRVYQFLREPLIRRFGEDWYRTLCEVAEEFLASQEK